MRLDELSTPLVGTRFDQKPIYLFLGRVPPVGNFVSDAGDE
jgi:hypothetical protein